MVPNPTASPAIAPALDAGRVADAPTDANLEPAPDDKKAASLAARKRTIAATMIYAGMAKPVQSAVQTFDAVAGAVLDIEKTPVVVRKKYVKKKSPPSRRQLVSRLIRAIGQELDLIEKIIGGADVDETLRTDAERRARTLAVLARTLGDLTKPRGDDDQGPAQDDDQPRDLEELRQRLSDRLARKIRSGTPFPDGGDVEGGDEMSG